MLRYGFFDSEIAGYDEEGMPIFDRAESSDFLAMFISCIISDGVLAIPGDCFQVVADEGMNLKVRPGFGIVKGRFAMDTNDFTITVPTAPSAYKRIDRVVLRANYKDRLCEIVVKEGTAAASPVPPELLRPAYGDFYELCLATVAVNSKQTVITQSNITDTRFDSSVCGLVTQVIDHLETSVFYAQFNQFYAEFTSGLDSWYVELDEEKQEKIDKYSKAMEELLKNSESKFQTWFIEEVQTWFDNLKAELSENDLINLQNQIGNLKDLTTEDNSSLTAALNEVKSSLTEGINEAKESGVTEIKGAAETTYRKGKVNITAENIGALPTAGGAMTGNIDYQGTKARHTMIKFLDNILDGYGNGIEIGGGGAVIIGGGESAQNIEPLIEHSIENPNGGIERLLLCNDQGIDFYTGVQQGADAAVHTQITNQGVFISKGLEVEANDSSSYVNLVRRVDNVIQRRGMLQISMNNNMGMWDSTNARWVYYAPLDGTPRFLGTADTAIKATQDGLGNVIANTYLNKNNAPYIEDTITLFNTTSGIYYLGSDYKNNNGTVWLVFVMQWNMTGGKDSVSFLRADLVTSRLNRVTAFANNIVDYGNPTGLSIDNPDGGRGIISLNYTSNNSHKTVAVLVRVY